MSTPRKALFERLPEIYRILDQEQARARRLPTDEPEPKGPLQSYLEILDEIFGGIRDNIEALYHDLFIETCDDWVVPYIADLLGTSHLSGDPWTIRADVARTVKHRRRKGTLGAIESLTYTLTGWAVHAVELRERMAWNQHLNHQRPDAGGTPPLALRENIHEAVRGGTVTLRSPAALSFLNGPFDSFAHLADVKPPAPGALRINLPNLGIFLWTLEDYQLPISQPVFVATVPIPPATGAAAFAVRFHLDPGGNPMPLFNTHRYQADEDPPNLTSPDAVPGPMPIARLTAGAPEGRPEEYVATVPYSNTNPPAPEEVGLTLHVPDSLYPATGWTPRGANLCAWEQGMRPPLGLYEVAIDPRLGRVAFGVADDLTDGADLRNHLMVSPTYGFAGPTGAHPIGRSPSPAMWLEQPASVITVNWHTDPNGLQNALASLDARTAPLIVEIDDSMTHDLNLAAVTDVGSEAGRPTLLLGSSLWIRATNGQRPVIRLACPLGFRPADVTGAGAPAVMANLTVRLEGLFLTRGADFDPLIQQAALNRLTLEGCTLDPGGQWFPDGSEHGARRPSRCAMRLDKAYGFADAADETAFDQTPVIEIYRSICGALEVDDGYELELTGSIVDAGSGIEDSAPRLAICAATGNAEQEWGPPLTLSGLTVFGRVRVQEAGGEGGVFLHRLEVHDNQKGCLRFSYVSGDGDRLPPWHGLVFGPAAAPRFTSEWFGQPGYAQLRPGNDRRILGEGPGNDEMGAFGYLRNAHKWKNINIRYREFMPVGTRPILVPVT